MNTLRTLGVAATLAICLALQGGAITGERHTEEEPAEATVDFERDVAPIFERCHPCHFPGGRKYADLPFDDPETIQMLGEKLFTRIKDENEQAIVRTYLAQQKQD
jgi:hypothetical protein